VNIFAIDLNNRESATDVAPRAVWGFWSQAHLTAAQVPDAGAVVQSLYAAQRPSEEAYQEEVATFKDEFDRVMQRACFAKAAQLAAGDDPVEFKRLMESTRSDNLQDMRAALELRVRQEARYVELNDKFVRLLTEDEMQELIDLGVERRTNGSAERLTATQLALESFDQGLEQIPTYQPASRDEFYGRYVDEPMHVHEAVYREAHKLALEACEKKFGATTVH
jgi:hypothetical protein